MLYTLYISFTILYCETSLLMILQVFFCKFDQVHPLNENERAILNLENSNMFCRSATHR